MSREDNEEPDNGRRSHLPTFMRPFDVDQLLEQLQRARGAAIIELKPYYVYAITPDGWDCGAVIPADDFYITVYPDRLTRIGSDELPGTGSKDPVPWWMPESQYYTRRDAPPESEERSNGKQTNRKPGRPRRARS